jgi:hypothetical protein
MVMSGIPFLRKGKCQSVFIRTKEKLGHITCSYTSSWELFPHCTGGEVQK